MNDIDRVLSATADFFEDQLAKDPQLVQQFDLLFANNQNPHVLRLLKAFAPQDVGLLIRVGREAMV